MLLTSDHEAVQEAVRAFVQSEVAPHAAAWDKSHEFPRAALQGLASLGCYGVAVPAEWDEDEQGPAPKILVDVPRKPRPGEVPGVGDRALLRTEEIGEDGDAIRHRGRAIKILDRAKQIGRAHV